jgi:hypothetical protein
MIKIIREIGIKEKFLLLIKSIYKNPTVSPAFNGGRQHVSLLRLRIRQGRLFSSLLLNIVLDTLALQLSKRRNEQHTD